MSTALRKWLNALLTLCCLFGGTALLMEGAVRPFPELARVGLMLVGLLLVLFGLLRQ